MTEYEQGFWLLIDDEWVEVDKAKYVAAERAAGFNGPRHVPATAAFLGLDGSCGSTLRSVQLRPSKSKS
jgi:hypothetical protein